MKRHNALVKLSQDHHHALILSQLLKKDIPDYQGMPNTTEGKVTYTINFFNSELVTHFDEEEKILFPFASGYDDTIDKLINELLDEHKRIYEAVDSLNSPDNIDNKLDKLGNMLDAHVRKEERELFMLIQEKLPEEKLNELEKKFDAAGNE